MPFCCVLCHIVKILCSFICFLCPLSMSTAEFLCLSFLQALTLYEVCDQSNLFHSSLLYSPVFFLLALRSAPPLLSYDFSGWFIQFPLDPFQMCPHSQSLPFLWLTGLHSLWKFSPLLSFQFSLPCLSLFG